MTRFFQAMLGFFLAAMAVVAVAQTFPARPVRLIVPYSVGTPPDILGRIGAEHMQRALGQPIVVENRPGATGTIGLAELLRQPSDGHTILAMPMPVSVAPSLYPNLKLDLQRDIAPVGQMAWSYNVLVVHPEVSAKQVSDLVSLLKGQPNKLSFGSGGNGTPAHLAAELFKLEAGVQAVHVPYVQFPQAIGDLVAGRLQFMFLASAPAVAQINGNKLRALAVTGPQRLEALKDVPTMVESGFPNFVVRDWQGLVVRAGTPQSAVQSLNAALNQAIADPQVQAQLKKMGNDVAGGTPEQFRMLINADVARWAKVVNAAGIKVD
jgi:tripartite-type tricarboxylate transporter receptor subunit TctC